MLHVRTIIVLAIALASLAGSAHAAPKAQCAAKPFTLGKPAAAAAKPQMAVKPAPAPARAAAEPANRKPDCKKKPA